MSCNSNGIGAFGNNWLWIIILIILFGLGGNNGGCGCGGCDNGCC